jgi:predicted NUDIX family NTP pyrophosphohydrolase
MQKTSAGILLWRRECNDVRVLLVHPGGPFWAKKDFGAWSTPKGEYDSGDDPLTVARREFEEELGAVPSGAVTPLGNIRQKAGKVVTCFAIESEFDVSAARSNVFEMEWPPRSGRRQSFPEVDRAAWFTIEDAHARINPAQAEFLDRLLAAIG